MDFSHARGLARHAATTAYHRTNAALTRLDEPDEALPPASPGPLFIVGPPRSGSTLLYQTVAGSLDVEPITNLHHALYGAPWLVSKVVPRHRLPTESSFESVHGTTRGAFGVSEAWNLWYRFFPPPLHHAVDVSAEHALALRSTIRRLGLAARRPVVAKNLNCSLILRPIAAALPEARFVVVRRDLMANARSLLVARQRTSGVESWFSVRPPSADRLEQRNPAEQVVGQIGDILRIVEEDADHIGTERFLTVHYEDLCESPRAVLRDLRAWWASGKANPSIDRMPPRSFSRGDDVHLEPDLEAELHAAAAAAP